MSHDLVIMYSGGLDSLIAYHYANSKKLSPLCLHLNMGQPYAEKELASINRKSEWHPPVCVLSITDLYPLISTRLTNQIIPSRNVLLAVIGSMLAPRVWINALDGEQNGKEHDKSPKFYDDASSLLTFTNDFFQPTSVIESPFTCMSKGEVIKWALAYGIPTDVLINTSSCYDDTEMKCGKCLTCVKRYLAFLENDIDEPGYLVDPLKTDYFHELSREIPAAIERGDYSRFTEKRAHEFVRLLNKGWANARV